MRLVLPALFLIAACGGDGPTLERLRCLHGASACQAGTNPNHLELAVDFEDPDGDLGNGVGRPLIDGVEEETFPLRPLFLERDLDLDGTSGTLNLTLNLNVVKPRDGQQFDLAIEVQDEHGNASNRPTITFRVDRP